MGPRQEDHRKKLVIVSAETATLIFARLDSARLPGKALRSIAGRPMLGRVLDRVRLARWSGEIVVATSDRTEDDPLAEFANDEGVMCFRGSINDVAARALAAAEATDALRFVRISGDSPFIDPELIDHMVALHARTSAELTTNLNPRSFPAGVSVEVVQTAAMRRLTAATTTDDEREHVTLHFYRHSDCYRIVNHTAGGDRLDDVALVVDTESDLERAIWITNNLGASPESAPRERVVEFAREWSKRAS